jgi:hypothetical protein
VLLLCPGNVIAYSVLTHEAIIDVVWQPVLVPLLKQRYPAATEEDLKNAHAYAYGGAITPDMGYYPFGNRLFSDMVHYVRNGDFILTLQQEAGNVREYAFALGMLAHYVADKYGHALGVNIAEPLIFPKLRDRFGPVITYEEAPTEHVRTEFGFDVLQTARGNYASDAYHRFISFEVADSLLQRAFRHNYDLDIDSIFKNYRRSVRTFRWAVKDIFPQLTHHAWKAKHTEILKQDQTATARRFHYRMRRQEFYTIYGKDIERPGFGARLIAGILHIMPKAGPLKPLKAAIPGPEAEKLFIQSFDTVIIHYRAALTRLNKGPSLANIDFDTGQPSVPGEYRLADKTYYELLMKLQNNHFATISSGLKEHLLHFYAEAKPENLAYDPRQRQEIQNALYELQHTNPKH